MSLKTLSADEARRMVANGAVLIDVREPGEFQREHIDGAVLIPLSSLGSAALDTYRGRKVIFHCQSGGRTTSYARRLADAVGGNCEGFVLGGGLLAWRAAGLPTDRGAAAGSGLLGRLFGR